MDIDRLSVSRNIACKLSSHYAVSRGLTKLALFLIGGLYAASFFLPVTTTHAICTCNGITGIYPKMSCGWEVFWEMIETAVYLAKDRDILELVPPIIIVSHSLVWLANPIAWLGFVGMVKEKGGLVIVAGLIAFLFGFSACLDIEKLRLTFPYGSGYYAWLLSLFTMAFFGVWLMLVKPRKQ
jgi:hypothetical protein